MTKKLTQASVMMSIPEAAKRMSLTSAYVRTLIRKDRLASHLVPIAPESLVMRHMISEEDVVAFLQGTPRKTKRADNRNKYVFYATPEEHQAVVEALEKAGLHTIVDMMGTANKLKPRSEPHGK